MNVRKGIEADKNELIKMWEYSFGDSDSFIQYYFSKVYDKSNVIVGEIDENIMCGLHLNQYNMNINGLSYDTSYLVGVATKPEARGLGYMSKIIKEALNEMYTKDQAISILMPIDSRIYEPFGYGFISDQNKYKISLKSLPYEKNSIQLRQINDEDIPLLVEFYIKLMENKYSFIIRDEDLFRRIIQEIKSEGGYTYLAFHKNKIVGYIFYYLQGDSMEVREIGYDNLEVLLRLMNFIKSHETQILSTTINESTDGLIKQIISHNSNCEINLLPFMMARIINIKKFCECLKLNKKAFGTMVIDVVDNFLAPNNRTLLFSFDGQSIAVKETSDSPCITLSINRLTQLLFGYLSYKQIVFLDRLQYSEKADFLFKCIDNQRTSYFNEYI